MPDFVTFPLSSLAEAMGGAGLFILGMKTISEGLQHFAGNRFRVVVERVSRNRVSAAFIGTCLASLLQSGSSASIIVVGFINAGLISLYQALAFLLGTSLGATVAVQLIAFQVSGIALPSIFIGILLKFFCKKRYLVNAGELVLGAGLIFLGLNIMGSGFAPISQSAIIKSINEYVFAWRISAVLFGALITFLVQSSLTSIGITIVLCGSGLISFTEAVDMVIGSNLGIAMITLLAALSGTLAAKRAAIINIIINSLAILLVLLLYPLFLKVVTLFTPGSFDIPLHMFSTPAFTPEKSLLPRLIANTHTLFNIFMLLLFLPLIGFFTRSALSLSQGKSDTGNLAPYPQFLDIRVINTPTIAMLQSRNEIRRMSEIASSMIDDLVRLFYRFDAKGARLILEKETALDALQKQISNFLVLLSRQHIDFDESIRIPVMLHIVNGLEELGDLSVVILEKLQKKKYEKIHFSINAMSDLKKLAASVSEVVMILDSDTDFTSEDQARADELAAVIREMKDEILAGHVKRMKSGSCTVEAGLLYNDIVASFVKLSEGSSSIIKTWRELE
jgi:phosphate:Na+ symporter